MSKLFQYAIYWQPNEEQVKKSEKPKMLVEVKTVLSSDEKGAFVLASREIPEEYLNQLDQIQVVVRPF